MADVQAKHRLSILGATQRVLANKSGIYQKTCNELYKDKNSTIDTLLDAIASSHNGRQKMKNWIASSSGEALVHEIVAEEMDTVTAHERMCNLKDITLEFISNWQVEDHKERAPFTCALLRTAAQTKRAKKENKLKTPDVVSTV